MSGDLNLIDSHHGEPPPSTSGQYRHLGNDEHSLSQLQCRLCSEGFTAEGPRIPRLLHCGHTLCHSCAVAIHRNSSGNELHVRVWPGANVLICPFDRQATCLVGEGDGAEQIGSLRKNFALIDLLERTQIARPVPASLEAMGQPVDEQAERQLGVICDEAEDNHLAVVFCTVCESSLCLPCVERTHSSRSLKRHPRVPLSLKPRQKAKCAYHSAYVYEFVCLDEACASDNPLMCILCRDYGRHMKHRHALLDTECQSFRDSVANALLELRRFQAIVQEIVQQCASAVVSIAGFAGEDPTAQCSLASVIAQVRAHFASLRAQLVQQEEEAVEQVDSHVSTRLAAIRTREEECSTLLAQLDAVCAQLERSMEQDDRRLMVGRKDLQLLLSSVDSQRTQFDSQPAPSLDPHIPVCFTKDNRLHIGPKVEMRVVSLGLDESGKTTILFKLKHNEIIQNVSTIGFNVETIEYKNLRLTIWDVGGVPKLRPLWKHYYLNTQALIFVVDSSDHERLTEAQSELVKLLSEDDLKDAVLLILLNKQDLDNAKSVDELSAELSLAKLCYGRVWSVYGCSAHNGSGLLEGVDWLTRQLVSIQS